MNKKWKLIRGERRGRVCLKEQQSERRVITPACLADCLPEKCNPNRRNGVITAHNDTDQLPLRLFSFSFVSFLLCFSFYLFPYAFWAELKPKDLRKASSKKKKKLKWNFIPFWPRKRNKGKENKKIKKQNKWIEMKWNQKEYVCIKYEKIKKK